MHDRITNKRLTEFNAAFQGNNCDYAHWGKLFREAYDYLCTERKHTEKLEHDVTDLHETVVRFKCIPDAQLELAERVEKAEAYAEWSRINLLELVRQRDVLEVALAGVNDIVEEMQDHINDSTSNGGWEYCLLEYIPKFQAALRSTKHE